MQIVEEPVRLEQIDRFDWQWDMSVDSKDAKARRDGRQ